MNEAGLAALIQIQPDGTHAASLLFDCLDPNSSVWVLCLRRDRLDSALASLNAARQHYLALHTAQEAWLISDELPVLTPGSVEPGTRPLDAVVPAAAHFALLRAEAGGLSVTLSPLWRQIAERAIDIRFGPNWRE